MKYKPITQQPAFDENPFVEKAIEDIKIIQKTTRIRPKNGNEIHYIVDPGTGEVEGHTAFMKFVEVDEQQFAKIYVSQFAAFWELTKPAIRVFGYIITRLKPKQDFLYFDMEDCLKHTGYSQANHILTGLSCLVECGIIARSNKTYKYFINPLVVFNGDRVSFAKTYIKKKKQGITDELAKGQLALFGGESDGIPESKEEVLARKAAEQKARDMENGFTPITEEELAKIEIRKVLPSEVARNRKSKA
jgi:hypothetical protein